MSITKGTGRHTSSVAGNVPLTAPPLPPNLPQPLQGGHLFSRRSSLVGTKPPQQQQAPEPQATAPPADVATAAVAAPAPAPVSAPPAAQQHAEQHEIAWAMPGPTSRRVTHRGASPDMLVLPAAPQSKPASAPSPPPLPAASMGASATATTACQLDLSSHAAYEKPWQEDDSISLDEQLYVRRQLEEVAARLMAVAPRARAQSLLPSRLSIDASPGDEVSGKCYA
jgi:hypothetical protein